jgi:hypothetical protein
VASVRVVDVLIRAGFVVAGLGWLISPSLASTGCDAASNGDFNRTANIAEIDLQFGGDFDEGDQLTFTTNGNTLLFVLTHLPSLQLFTWVGADSDTYEIPSTGTYAFTMALTGALLAQATVTVTCAEATDPDDPDDPDDPEEPDDPDDPEPPDDPDPPAQPDGAKVGAIVDDLLNAGRSGAGDALTRRRSVDGLNIRREFLLRNLRDFENRVAALELLFAVASDDPDVVRWLSAARARVAAIHTELGLMEVPAAQPALAFADPSAKCRLSSRRRASWRLVRRGAVRRGGADGRDCRHRCVRLRLWRARRAAAW